MRDIVVHEVGMRDGLQIERSVVPTDVKLRWIDKLLASGVDLIQVGSFVHREKVPQMGDTDELFAQLATKPEATRRRLSALVLNEKGLERGLACGVEFFCMGASASDTHSRKNTGMGSDEAVRRVLAMAHQAVDAGKRVQLSVQSAFGCGFEGAVPQQRVLAIVAQYLDAGFGRISLADTAGHATPDQVESLFEAILKIDRNIDCACHFHDTYGMAMANCYAALRAGVRSFEAAFGGLGGCPFTALSGGNVATEDLVHMFQRMGARPDIRLQALAEIVADAEEHFGRKLPGVVHRTGPIPAPALEMVAN